MQRSRQHGNFHEDQDVVLKFQFPEYEFKHVVPPELPVPLWKRGCAAMIDLGVSIVTCSVIGAMYLS